MATSATGSAVATVSCSPPSRDACACRAWRQRDQRIADLLGRLTLAEKVDLMSNHPKIPRLGVVFSGQVEGLHGLALGGPGGWGPRGKQPLPTTTFPQEKGLGATWDPDLLKKIAGFIERPFGRIAERLRGLA